MPIVNMQIQRVCLHEIHRLTDDGRNIPPVYGTELLDLPNAAMEAFRGRVVAAFKSTSQCMEMQIRDNQEGSVFLASTQMIGTDDADFLNASRFVANRLTGAQTSRQIPGGLLAVFDGTLGPNASPFIGLMKAEMHEGFLKTDNLQVRFVQNLFLSPKTKLYKIGIFASDVEPLEDGAAAGWSANVYDSTMSASNRDNAANYFYNSFLGLSIPENAAHNVRKFFEFTRAFIRTSGLSADQKNDLYNGLYTYLKVDQSNTIQTSRFAQQYMQEEISERYIAEMRRQRFPVGAVAKDLSEVSAQLRLRKVRFPRKIVLSGPPEAIHELVSVDSFLGEDGSPWTRITVRAEIESQE